MRGRDFREAIERELQRWPGVSGSFERRKKHPAVVLSYGDRTASTTFPATSSDHRALLNKISDIRRTLRAWGVQETAR